MEVDSSAAWACLIPWRPLRAPEELNSTSWSARRVYYHVLPPWPQILHEVLRGRLRDLLQLHQLLAVCQVLLLHLGTAADPHPCFRGEMGICMYACMHACMYVCMYVVIFTWEYICDHIYIYIYVYIYIHTCIMGIYPPIWYDMIIYSKLIGPDVCPEMGALPPASWPWLKNNRWCLPTHDVFLRDLIYPQLVH